MFGVGAMPHNHFDREGDGRKGQQNHTNLLAKTPALMQILEENYMTLVIRI